jgi:RNA polymerase sigma factor (sigma-70 family)
MTLNVGRWPPSRGREGVRYLRRIKDMTHPSDAVLGAGAAGSWPGRGTDEQLLAMSLHQPEVFGELYARHFAVVYRYVAGRLGTDAADDLAAETFLAAFRRRHRFDPARGAVKPWLFGMATNLVARHRRAESRWYAALARAGSDPLVAPAARPSDEDRIADRVAASQARPLLAAALALLPDRDRDVLLLVAVGGLSYAEAAFALGIPEGTVGSRLSRARRKIIAVLDQSALTADGFPATLWRN